MDGKLTTLRTQLFLYVDSQSGLDLLNLVVKGINY
jgi:hypothetical protein